MFKKIFFLLAVLIILVISFSYVVFTKNNQPSSPYYKVSNEQINNLTTITQKEKWKESNSVNLLAKTKIDENFIGRANNLGIIAISFDTHNKSVDDKIVFRLKEAGRKDWYYQATYDAKQIQNNVPFPFGFPIITNSKNILFTLEVESLSGRSGDTLSLNQTDNYFFTKYKFFKSELIRNPNTLLQFAVSKIREQLLLLTQGEIVNVFLLSAFPIFILTILTIIGLRFEDIKAWLLKLFKKYKMELVHGQSMKIKERDYKNIFSGFLITFSVIAFVVLLTGILSFPLTGQRKWIPYLSILIPSGMLGLNFLKTKLFNNGYFLIIAGFISSAVLTLGILNYESFSWSWVSAVLIIGCCLVIIPLMKYFSFVFVGTLVFLLGINSVVFINSYEWSGLIWTAFVTLVIIFAFLLSLSNQSRFKGWVNINKVCFAVLLIISSLLALRSDSLFLGSSEYHWGYFTGVIQTIRSGGELLWSAPSQYGLLNVLLPSVLPWTSRNSFFIFQAILFFICSSILIKTVYTCFKHKAAFILIALSGLSLFYFADPAIIGPTLYPSSSAVRFFGVYILIYVILREYRKRSILTGGIKWIITGAYILGALWSAESIFYCTAIYISYLFFSAISISKKGNGGLRFFLVNSSVIFIAFIITNVSYLIMTGHFPDWSMYYMYAFEYANGFGEFIIRPWGIIWAIVIAFSSIIFISSRLYSAKKYGEWIVVSVCSVSLWILTSYFVGRAVTNNLTAILPLIFYVFIVTLSVLIEAKFFTYRLLLTSVFLPWIVVGVIGGIGNPQFIKKIQQFQFAQDINSKSFKPDKELSSIFKSLGVMNGVRIAYYGDLNNNPIIPYKGGYLEAIAGMPMPLVLLEEPISKNKRSIIVERFFSKLHEPVFLIHRKSENLGRFPSWKKFFEQNYKIGKVDVRNEKYEVFLVARK
jgi:hypothetical protein